MHFAAYLEANAQNLRWWYKNGDSGKEHFAVPYRNLNEEWSLFHVDFVLELADGTLAFFDTKTIGGDPNAARKHNALLGWLDRTRQDRPGRRFIGGVLIEDGNCWRYSRHRLEDHFNTLNGWTTFHLGDFAGAQP
jgi:type III restriction enzyme